MSEPAVFVVIRDGEKRVYHDRWAHMFLYRHLLWGPESLDQWLAEEDEDGEFDFDICGGVVVNFDEKRLLWDGDDMDLELPPVGKVLDRLLQCSWPGYSIEYASRGIADLAAAAGENLREDSHEEFSEDFALTNELPDELSLRPETISEAAGIDDDDEFDDEPHDDDDDDDDDSFFDDDELRAWVTIINQDGSVRHRYLGEIPLDLIFHETSVIADLLDLEPAEVPPESVVREGIWFDLANRTIGVWGRPIARAILPHLQEYWTNWDVRWADEGYQSQCGVSGPSGIPMSDVEALAKLTPKILSTQRVDLSSLLGAMGSSLKRTAVRATGCFALVLAAPVVLLGLIAGNMKAAAITIAIVWMGIAIIFKFVAWRFKRKFLDGALVDLTKQDSETGCRSPVAGPLDPVSRREQLETLLAEANLPSLAEIEPHVGDGDNAIGFLS